MARDGSGNFSRSVTPPVNGDVADATNFNAEMDDISSAISDSINKAGTKALAANLPMGGFKLTGLAAGANNGDSVRFEQLGAAINSLITTAGSANAYTLTSGQSLLAYAAGQQFFIKANFTNTGAATINVDSIGAKSLTKNGATALAAGDLTSGQIYIIDYDGTQFQVLNLSAAVDATLTALAALTTAASQYIRATGTDTFTMDSYATLLSNIGAQASLGYTPVNKAGDTMSGRLIISGDSSSNNSEIDITDTHSGGRTYRFGQSVGVSVGVGVCYDATRGGVAYQWDASGNFTSFGTLTGASDERLKENIRTLENSFEAVMALRGVSFDWKDGRGRGVGLIAQEVEKVRPEYVLEEGGFKSVAYGNIVADLINAVHYLAEKLL